MELWSFTVVPPLPFPRNSESRPRNTELVSMEHELLGTRALAIATMETRQAMLPLDALFKLALSSSFLSSKEGFFWWSLSC